MNHEERIVLVVTLDLVKDQICAIIDTCIHDKEIITVPNTAVAGAALNNNNKNVLLKNWSYFTKSISEINDTQVCSGY